MVGARPFGGGAFGKPPGRTDQIGAMRLGAGSRALIKIRLGIRSLIVVLSKGTYYSNRFAG